MARTRFFTEVTMRTEKGLHVGFEIADIVALSTRTGSGFHFTLCAAAGPPRG